MATLYQISNDGYSIERWDIDEESVVVGRSGQAQVSVEDEGLSGGISSLCTMAKATSSRT